ncbi:MAG TPA: gamma-glutamyltransferase family protein [Verrucomicrobiae bacterium]|jgi:gamma-glutamyltranspeptidase / glutathione hydrolase|nr:gamma-glutamyltransferase family protein [Verrucomicrobiae bacterium]
MRDFQRPRRSAAFGASGMAATSHPDATLAALEILKRGGNAMDAAIGAVALLGVVETHMTGIGGDCFVLYAPAGGTKDGPVIAFNGSGAAPAAATVEKLRSLGITEIGEDMPHAVTIPGAVDAWCRLHGDHGKLPLAEILAPAIAAAENGILLHPRVAHDWAGSADRLRGSATARDLFLPGDAAPAAGDRHRQPQLAATLRRIGKEGRSAFYEGAVARDMVTTLHAAGGLHTEEDFAGHRGEYVTPIRTTYRGVDVYECPPNGQGLAALMILNGLAGFEMGSDRLLPADRIHLLAEATKLAYAVRDARFADPRQVKVPADCYLSDNFAKRMRDSIKLNRAGPGVLLRETEHKDTVYLCVVDRDGNAVSFINSLFELFGSTILARESGVMLHNRGLSFRLDPGHPNCIAPGKRPMHTIIPGMLVEDGKALAPFGVMGGHYQATGHAWVVHLMLDRGLDPQAAVEAPRSFAHGGVLALETTHTPALLDDLRGRGHDARWAEGSLGGGQIIRIDRERGVLIGGSDPRKDGCAMGLS